MKRHKQNYYPHFDNETISLKVSTDKFYQEQLRK